MAQIGQDGPYEERNGAFGACARILDSFGTIAGKLYGCGFLGMYPGDGVGKEPYASVEWCGDHLLGDALEAVWGIEKVLQEGLKFPESMDTIMRNCSRTFDKEAVHNYVLKMNMAVTEWMFRGYWDWVHVEPDLPQRWTKQTFGKLAAAFFDMSARAKPSWSPQSQSAATEHASQSKKQLRKRDAGHQKKYDDAIPRKSIVGCHNRSYRARR